MARIDFFHYREGPSVLKKVDPRIKMPLVLIYTLAVYNTGKTGLIIISVFIVLLALSSKPREGTLAEMKGVYILSVIIFSAAFFTTGDLFTAAYAVWKFILTIILGILLITTTHPEEIEKASWWYLSLLPFIKASDTAIRIRLTITFIPELLETASAINEARLSRCIQTEKNPLKKVKTLVVPLLYAIIRKADTTALALESRCYTNSKKYSFEKLGIYGYLQAAAGLLIVSAGFIV